MSGPRRMKAGRALIAALVLLLVVTEARAEAGGDAKGLLALKAIVENRETLASWKEGSKPCGEGSTANWFFVVCENGRVVELRMAGLLLNSTLPEEMALLTELQILELSGANLEGELPDAWGKAFKNLRALDLSGNSLTGALPDGWGGKDIFPNLRLLRMSSNKFSGSLPDSWASEDAFSELEYMDLSGNSIGGTLPNTLGKAVSSPNMQALLLGQNNFTGKLPPEWAYAFPALQILVLSNNNLTGEIPPEWMTDTAFPSLTTLDLTDNWLGGSYNETELEAMDRNLPAELGAPGSWDLLNILSLAANNFTGPVPADWAQPGYFINLQALYLGDNWLDGSLPDAWAEPDGAFAANLTILDLSNNTLIGTLNPMWATGGGLASVTELNLLGNQLYGELPGEWGLWTSLTDLFLDGNPISGELPEMWAEEGSSMNTLSLCQTNITGPIPTSWQAADVLADVDIYTEVPGGICGELSEKFTDPESGASVLKCLGYGIGQRVKELPAC